MKKVFIALAACFVLISTAYAADGWYLYNGDACTGDNYVGFTDSYSVLLILWSHGHFNKYRELQGGKAWHCRNGLPEGEAYETR